MTLKIKRGDTLPSLELTCTDPDGGGFAAVDSWRVLIKLPDGTISEDATPIVVVSADHTTATITHLWDPSETATAGTLSVEAEATWPDSSVQTFPPESYATVKISPDLG